MTTQVAITRGITAIGRAGRQWLRNSLPAFIGAFFLLTPLAPGQQKPNVHKVAATTAAAALSPSDSLKALQLLKGRIEQALTNSALKGASYGLMVHSLDAHRTLYAYNETKLLTPASTTKLFSTFTAFLALGGDYNVPTSVYTDVGAIDNGVLKGNIYLVGSGDPLLSTADIEQLADQIHNLGIKRITGHVYGDASYFDGVTDRVAYSGDADVVEPLPPISALSLNRNTITILVTSGGNAGAPVRVQTVPVSDAFTFSVSATVKGGRRAKPNIGMRSSKGADGKQLFTITGSLPPRRTASYSFVVTNPALVAAGVLRRRLEAVGVTIEGTTGVQAAPLATSRSLTAFYRPLGTIVSQVNKHSDNYCAEHIFKMVGGTMSDQNNTAVAARSVMKTSFTKCAIPFQNCCINDGSGLSRRNLVTPQTLTNLLMQAWEQPFAQNFINSLPVAGVDGTLRRRMKGTPAEGNLIGKTGTLRNVSALAGYVTTIDGEQLAFSLMFNGGNVGAYKLTENAIGKILAEFSYRSPDSVSEQ